MRCYLDIETLPSLAPDAREQVRATIRPPANYKKPETIAAWWADEGEAAVDRAWRQQALDGAAGELCAIGFADDDSTPVSLVRREDEPEREFLGRALAGVQELADTWSVLDAGGIPWPADPPFFIAHHAPFDLGFLQRRCWVHGIRAPFPLLPATARHGRDYGCTMQTWSGSPREFIGLDRLCRALGLPSPKEGGIDGSKVLDLWLAGDREAIGRYNARDVAAVRACWHRLTWFGEDAA